MEQEALYPFGYGLSYSDFAVEDVRIDTSEITDQGIHVSAKIKNSGNIAAGETLQVYVKVNQENSPNPQLKGFKKVHLAPQEEKEINIYLPKDAFGIYNEEGRKMVYKGDYHIFVGNSQPDSRSIMLLGKRPVQLTVASQEEKELN